MSDPWAGTPSGELGDQLLPRWFVLLAVLSVPVFVAVVVAAFLAFAPAGVGVAERRPPPGGGVTTAVGELAAGTSAPRPLEVRDGCAVLRGVQVAGSDADVALLQAGLAPLCRVQLAADTSEALFDFGRRGGIVRFAQFEATGVDSTAASSADPPVVYFNARFSRVGDPTAIAPLLVHDTTYLGVAPGTVAAALEARRREAAVCEALFTGAELPRGCADAFELLALEDPAGALAEAGFEP